jgi:hypothetical protein
MDCWHFLTVINGRRDRSTMWTRAGAEATSSANLAAPRSKHGLAMPGPLLSHSPTLACHLLGPFHFQPRLLASDRCSIIAPTAAGTAFSPFAKPAASSLLLFPNCPVALAHLLPSQMHALCSLTCPCCPFLLLPQLSESPLPPLFSFFWLDSVCDPGSPKNFLTSICKVLFFFFSFSLLLLVGFVAS